MRIHLHIGVYSENVEYREHFETDTSTDGWRDHFQSILDKCSQIVDAVAVNGLRTKARDQLIQDEVENDEPN